MPEQHKRRWRFYKTLSGACPVETFERIDDSNLDEDEQQDDLERMIAKATARNPEFPQLMAAAEQQRKLLTALRERRRQLELSQTQVAACIGTSHSALAALERREANPTLSTVLRLAAVLSPELEWHVSG